MAAKINHGALDTLYGIIVQARDGSWNPYTGMGQTLPGDEPQEPRWREMAKGAYGGEVPTRVVRFVAKVLCDNPNCPGHDDPEWSCVGFNDAPMVMPAPMLSDEPDDNEGPVIYRTS